MNGPRSCSRRALVTVSSYQSSRGFGFVKVPGLDREAYFHAAHLKDIDRASIPNGTVLEAEVASVERGWAVIMFYRIVEGPQVAHPEEIASIVSGEVEAGRVRWFDPVKGYGFVRPFGREEDAFLGRSVLNRAALLSVVSGEAIAFRYGAGRQGPVVTEIVPWDSVRIEGEA